MEEFLLRQYRKDFISTERKNSWKGNEQNFVAMKREVRLLDR